jgi:S-methylmethionine-dependent homocysteine/selenocysteine methylase
MPKYRDRLPQLDAGVFLTDGGIETTLIFDDGFELPDFAAFTLLSDANGRAALVRYFDHYAEIARRDGVGIVLETPTWRANPDWATRQGYAAADRDAANRDAVALVLDTRSRWEQPGIPVVVSGCVGPRGDGYQPDSLMTAEEAQAYHAIQIGTFADTEADLVTAITMTYTDEAVGIARAARAQDLPVVISFTTETDGRLPTGETLGQAIQAVDAATGSGPAYYMVNCAHPSHFSAALDPDSGWTARIRGVRANASRLSHAELDQAEELDAGDPRQLAQDYLALSARLPQLTVLGGCCGTTHEHVGAISRAFNSR